MFAFSFHRCILCGSGKMFYAVIVAKICEPYSEGRTRPITTTPTTARSARSSLHFVHTWKKNIRLRVRVRVFMRCDGTQKISIFARTFWYFMWFIDYEHKEKYKNECGTFRSSCGSASCSSPSPLSHSLSLFLYPWLAEYTLEAYIFEKPSNIAS